MTGPATFVVALIVGIMLVAGALILGSSRTKTPQPPEVCPACRTRNAKQAKFCAMCGEKLPTQQG